MSAFDKVIGYESIKNELEQICDMIHNKEAYEKLGAKLPQGALLYGEPGLGKTLVAKSFIEEAGLPTYTIRRNKGDDDFIGGITETFQKAKENSPSIVFLDDMDKFANEDDDHRDAEEYVAVQSGIDEVKGAEVFVLATANDVHKLPKSLTRSGRFDRKICFHSPSDKDAQEIMEYYLSDKKVSDDIDMNDLSKMMSFSSCAELETILNEAAVKAAYERADAINMSHLVGSVLRMQYDSPDNLTKTDAEELSKVALHEAGHLVVSEIVNPGSVGLASIRSTGRDSTGGFIHICKAITNRRQDVLTSLGSKAAVELYYSENVASGCQADLRRAYTSVRDGITESGTVGLAQLDISGRDYCVSESWTDRNEAVATAELERYLLKAKDILLKNRDFLEKTRDALIEKETLLFSDIQRIKESCTIQEVAY